MSAKLECKRQFFLGILSGSIAMILIGQLFLCRYQSSMATQFEYERISSTKSAHNNTKGNLSKQPERQTSVTLAKTLTFQSMTQQPECERKPQENNTSNLLSISELIEATQAERKSIIRRACQRYFPKPSSCDKNNKQYIHQKNLVSKKYKLVTCDILKCGSSSWLKAMFVMEDIYTFDDYKNKRVHGKSVFSEARKKLRLYSVKNATLKSELWNYSFKVLTVRNPFSRIVSAYYDKLKPTSPGFSYYYKPMSFKISKKFRNLRHNVDERNHIGDGTATFEDFVNYLLTKNIDYTDPHFRSFLSSCKPCDAEYDYVIKFETLPNDMEYLKQKLNVSEYHRKAVFPQNSFKTNEDLVVETFKKIPNKLALKLYKKYQKDFDVFGYKKPEWLC